MATFNARLRALEKTIERRLKEGQEGDLWLRRNRDMEATLDVLRDLFAGCMSFEACMEWTASNPGPDAGRIYTRAEEAQRRMQFEDFKSQLILTIERMRNAEARLAMATDSATDSG